MAAVKCFWIHNNQILIPACKDSELFLAALACAAPCSFTTVFSLNTLHAHTVLRRPGSQEVPMDAASCTLGETRDYGIFWIAGFFTVPAKLSAIIDTHSLDTENNLDFSFWDMVSYSICWLQTPHRVEGDLELLICWTLSSKRCHSVHATTPVYATLRIGDRTSCFQGKYSTNWATFQCQHIIIKSIYL